MLKKYIFEIAPAPGDLGEAMTSTLAHEASALRMCNRDPDEIRELLMGDSDLSLFDLATLEHQRLYYDASKVKRTEAGLERWVQRRVLKGYDAAAREEIATQLHIGGLDTLAEDLVDLNKHAPNVVTKLLEGRVGEAALLVVPNGYGNDSEADDLPFDWIMTLIDTAARLWIANDLQMEAAKAFVRIFRPTGLNVLDGDYNGKAPINRTAVNRMTHDADLFDEAARLYFGEPASKRPGAFLARVANPSPAVTGNSTSSLVVAQPYVTIRKVGRNATLKEVARIQKAGDLELKGQIAYALWRQKHGDDLEQFVRRWMERGRAEVRSVRRGLERMESDKSKIRKPVFKRDVDPLTRLWLACERAVAWTEIERCQPLEGAIGAARGSRKVSLPALSPRSALNVQRANRLFFVLRCAIAHDPNHLPKGLCSVVTADGEVKVAANRHDAEAVRGEPFSFAEIQAFQEGRMPEGSERNSKEIYSHDYTTPGRKFAAEHRAHPTPESKRIDEQSWGTLLWRLGVRVAA